MNDFIVIQDRHGMTDLSADDVRWLCDRREGIGADGVLRAVKAEHIDGWSGDPGIWFMDYRNADGSMAETCGNGLRLFACYLMEEELVPRGELLVGTRAGVRRVWSERSGNFTATMGQVDLGPTTWVRVGGVTYPARAVDVGNPHAVALVPPETIDQLDLRPIPEYDTALFPDGVNVEFAGIIAPGQLKMRVHERGSGETLSCGTGVVASATVARDANPEHPGPWTVNVPGGRLVVTQSDDGEALLTGPATLVANGTCWRQ